MFFLTNDMKGYDAKIYMPSKAVPIIESKTSKGH